MHQLLKNKEDIIAWLDDHRITHYTLIADSEYGFVVDVASNVEIFNRALTQISVKFRHISGSFYCGNNQLTTLLGAPEVVGNTFSCAFNKLTSLEYAPHSVTNFNTTHNLLENLMGAPQIIGGTFRVDNNHLSSLMGAPTTIAHNFGCSLNNISSLDYFPAIVGGRVNLRGNALLGKYQYITDFKKISEITNSIQEKNLLDCLPLSRKSPSNKI